MGVRVWFSWHDSAARAAERAGEERGLADAADHLLAVSQRRVPLEMGPLQSTGVASVDHPHAAVSYGTVYARRQHEELTWRHAPGRTAKYLEGPLTEQAAVLRDLIAAGAREALR